MVDTPDIDPSMPLKNSHWEAFATKYGEHDSPTATARALGVSDISAKNEGNRLYNIPAIRARIEYLKEEERKKALITEGRITEELALIAFSNPMDYIAAALATDEPVRVKEGVNPNQIRAVAEIEVKDSIAGVRPVKFKLWPKTAALEMAIGLKGYGAGNKANGTNGVSGKGKDGEEDETPEQILSRLGLNVNTSNKKYGPS